MSVLTEGQRRSEFLLSEGNGDISREAGILTSGQSVVDGQAVKIVATKLVAATGSHHTDGSTDEVIAGLIVGNYDVSADTPVVYIARLATVKDSAVVYHTSTADTAKKAAVKDALANQFVIAR